MNIQFQDLLVYVFVFLIWLFILFILLVFSYIRKKENNVISIYPILFEGLGFSFLGLTIGYNIGLSVNAVVNAFVPAFLTFTSGFLVYMYSNKETGFSSYNSVRVTIGIALLSISIYIGGIDGAYTRTESESVLSNEEHIRQLEIKEIEYLQAVDSHGVADSSTLKFRNYLYEKIYSRDLQGKEIISIEELRQSFQ